MSSYQELDDISLLDSDKEDFFSCKSNQEDGMSDNSRQWSNNPLEEDEQSLMNWHDDKNEGSENSVEKETELWINEGFSKEQIIEWKRKGFDYWEAKIWIKKYLLPAEAKLASYLRYRGLGYWKDFEISKLRKDFLESGWKDWTDIHLDFADDSHKNHPRYEKIYQKEWEEENICYEDAHKLVSFSDFEPRDIQIIKKWKEKGFSIEKIQKLLKSAFNKGDMGFAKYLEVNGYDLEKSFQSDNFEELKENYLKETNDWMVIHLDFSENIFGFSTAQQLWEGENFTYQEAREWIKSGFKVDEYSLIESWKLCDFSFQEVKEWLDIGCLTHEYNFANYLRNKGYYPNCEISNFLANWRTDFEHENEENNPNFFLDKEIEKENLSTIDSREYIDEKFPKETRSEITELNIFNENLSGFLNLDEFVKLEKFFCPNKKFFKLILNNCLFLKELNCQGSNRLTYLDLSNNNQLRKIDCRDCFLNDINLGNKILLISLDLSGNQLTNLNFLNNISTNQLETLRISYNKFASSYSARLNIISEFTNLKELAISNNSFVGSLKFLQNLVRLEELDISKTDFNTGLEYLPSTLGRFICQSTCFEEELKDYFDGIGYNVKAWRENLDNCERWRKIGKELNYLKEAEKNELIELINNKIEELLTVLSNLERDLNAKFEETYSGVFILTRELNDKLKENFQKLKNKEGGSEQKNFEKDLPNFERKYNNLKKNLNLTLEKEKDNKKQKLELVDEQIKIITNLEKNEVSFSSEAGNILKNVQDLRSEKDLLNIELNKLQEELDKLLSDNDPYKNLKKKIEDKQKELNALKKCLSSNNIEVEKDLEELLESEKNNNLQQWRIAMKRLTKGGIEEEKAELLCEKQKIISELKIELWNIITQQEELARIIINNYNIQSIVGSNNLTMENFTPQMYAQQEQSVFLKN